MPFNLILSIYPVFLMAMPVNMILAMYVILCILSYVFNKLTMLYIHVHISISMTNKSGLTFFLSIKYLSVCLSRMMCIIFDVWRIECHYHVCHLHFQTIIFVSMSTYVTRLLLNVVYQARRHKNMRHHKVPESFFPPNVT